MKVETLKELKARAERDHVKFVLDACGWDVRSAAATLGVPRTYIYLLMQRHELRRPRRGRRSRR